MATTISTEARIESHRSMKSRMNLCSHAKVEAVVLDDKGYGFCVDCKAILPRVYVK